MDYTEEEIKKWLDRVSDYQHDANIVIEELKLAQSIIEESLRICAEAKENPTCEVIKNANKILAGLDDDLCNIKHIDIS